MQRLIGKVLDEEELLEQLEREEEMAQSGAKLKTHSSSAYFGTGSGGGGGPARPTKVLVKKESAMSDLGEEVIEDFMLEASRNMSMNSMAVTPKSAESAALPAGSAATSPTASDAAKGTRKVSYGDVTKVSFDPSPATNTSGGSDSEGVSARSNASNQSSFGTMGGNRGGITESLRYDLQSEDGDTMMAQREAAAAQALNAAHQRKNHAGMCWLTLFDCWKVCNSDLRFFLR
jgi:hypothetical protein